jgi:ParB family chromosome partitioning protein
MDQPGDRHVPEESSVGHSRLKLELWQLDLRYEGLRIVTPPRQGRILASLAEHGQQSPVLVVRAANGHYVLIDGYRRVSALHKLGRDTVEALVLPMGEAEALVYGLREARGAKRCALEEGWWVRELVEHHRFNLDRIAVSLERSKSWVSRRLALVKQLPEPVQTRVRQGKVCPHAAMRYLVPLARANKGACQRLTEHLGNARLSTRQMGKLYVAWRRADRSERSRLEENPLLYLKALEELERNPAHAEQATADHGNLLKDLEILIRVCYRIRQTLHEGKSSAAGETLTGKLDKHWQESLLAFETVKEIMEECLHAGHGRSQGHL